MSESVFLHGLKSHHGILYAEDFDDDLTVSAGLAAAPLKTESAIEQPVIIAPKFFTEDLVTARLEGYTAGRDAALTDAQVQHNDALINSCGCIAARLERDAAAGNDLIETSVAAATRLLVNMLASILPTTCDRHQAREVAGAIRSLVTDMISETVIQVGIARELHNDLKIALRSMPAHLTRRIVLCPTDNVAFGDATLSWVEGTATFSAGRARRAAIEVLELLHLIEPERKTASCIIQSSEMLSSLLVEEGESINV